MSDRVHLQQVRNEVLHCTKCELHSQCIRPVPISGSLPADFVVLGEAPGRIEDVKGIPFVGPAGRLLRRMLKDAKLDPNKAMFMNIVSCYPNGSPKLEHKIACKGNLVSQLMASCTDKLIVVGREALHAILPRAELKWTQGSILEVHGYTTLVAWHPSFLLRSQSKQVEADIRNGLSLFKWVLSGTIPATWARNSWCIYCGKDTITGDYPTCSSHAKTWRQDSKWVKPTQMQLDL